jgi:hypothetical protein
MVVLLVVATACDPGFINTPAGNGSPGSSGDGGAATSAAVDPVRIAWAPDGRWAFSDAWNHVRSVGTDGTISTIVGLGGFDVSHAPIGDGGPAQQATLSSPTGVAYDGAGDLFIADTGDNVVREVDHATGLISTFAGGGASTADGVAATTAKLISPTDLALDAANDLFIVESSSGLVRKVDGTTHLISTIAGGGASTAEGVLATTAHLTSPGQVAVAGTDLDIAEAGSVRQVGLGNDRIVTIAGTGAAGDSGDGGPATLAQVDAKSGLAVDSYGNVYFSQGNRVRKLVASIPVITTVAGSTASGYSGDLGASNAAQLNAPLGLAVNAAGTLLVADSGNHRVRAVQRIAAAPTTPSIAESVPLGGGHSWFGGDASKYGSSGSQPITYPNPGFWAQVAGPESDATDGDAHSPRCYGGNLCGSPALPANNDYRPAGYTYAITVPTTNVPSSLDVQVFDAGLYPRSTQDVETGDHLDSGSSNFTTDYQLFAADATPLDSTDNPAMTPAQCGGTAGIQSPSSGHWWLSNGDAPATFENNWVSLCHISAPVPGAVYFLRVRTDHDLDGTTAGAGFNRYALQVLNSSGSAASIAPFGGDESLFLDDASGSATFELANVGPQDAGRTLALSLWDPGDARSGADVNLTVQPPTGSASCTWNSIYGVGYASPPAGGNLAGGTPDAPSSSGGTVSPCVIATSTSGTTHFNGDWLLVRVQIPPDYSCDPATPSTCEWTVRYDATVSGLTDGTTWAAIVR